MVKQGYEIEKGGRNFWYITSKRFGNVMGPFRRMGWAIDYAKRIDAVDPL